MHFETEVGTGSEEHAKVQRPARPRLLIPRGHRGRVSLLLHGTGEPGGRGREFPLLDDIYKGVLVNTRQGRGGDRGGL